MRIGKNIVAAACGLALAATMAAPAVALAADVSDSNQTKVDSGNTGSTAINIKVKENIGPDGKPQEQLSFTIPTQIDFAAEGTGNLKAAAYTIKNNSVYPIRVKNVKVEALNGWNLVEKSAFDSQLPNHKDVTNKLWFYLEPANEIDGEKEIVNSYVASQKTGGEVSGYDIASNKWDIASNGSLEFTPKGKIGDVTKNILEAGQAANVTWTLTSGSLNG